MLQIEMLIKKYYDHLNENDLSTLRYIIENKRTCAEKSITDIARDCNISRSSILRTTQKLGFSGFSEFKYALKNDLHTPPLQEKDYFQQIEMAMHNTLKFFKSAELMPIYDKINHSDKIYAYGTGYAQRNAVNELKRNFLNFGIMITSLDAGRELGFALKWIRETDLLIVVSLSGDIPDIMDDLKLLRVKKVPVLSITDMSFDHNILANIVPYNLFFQSTRYPVNNREQISQDPVSMASLNVLCEALSFGYLFQYRSQDQGQKR